MLPVRRTWRRGLVAALGATLLLAAPASAHPFVRGGEVPVDSLATITLAMAHGCGGDGGGEEEPTLEVALEVPEWLRVVEVADTEGYTAEVETAADGTVDAVVWTADGEGELAPDLDLDVVASGEEGDERYLAVFQGCENASYRWVGTPDEPAEDPAIGVTLTAADPDSPPPPEEEVPAADEDGPEDPVDTVVEDPADEPGDSADDEPAPDQTTAESESDDTTTDEAAAPGEQAADEGGVSVALIVLLVLVAVVAALVAARRRGGASTPGAGPEGDA
ncbi:hypothetical protein [Egicoccus sp. AB-alg2]|uniref:hypothetical protein n=1 Tax=Egicoccus sp. AB-alg2 TaxID=3242693 RepID=UPI00359D369E